MSNIDQQGAKPGFNMTSVALGEGKSARRLAMVDVMSSLLRKRTDKQIGYSVSQLVQLRHQMLRFARSLPQDLTEISGGKSRLPCEALPDASGEPAVPDDEVKHCKTR
ncbi:hypothetical protein [Bradyrhizobium japonicum]|uniref:hypothetical protein n=1 Tax=Bradyrhizobium japonicum TaxID=375 RepID=UPI001181997D|nr:hypothetical protein [Bradyrhizobium japonicum]